MLVLAPARRSRAGVLIFGILSTMSAEGPKDPRVVNLEEVRERKIRDEIRRQLEAALGRKISVSEFTQQLALTRGRKLAQEFLSETPRDGLNEELIRGQRENAEKSSTSNLLQILNLAQTSQGRFGREVIIATAETLLERFPDEPPPPEAA